MFGVRAHSKGFNESVVNDNEITHGTTVKLSCQSEMFDNRSLK